MAELNLLMQRLMAIIIQRADGHGKLFLGPNLTVQPSRSHILLVNNDHRHFIILFICF